MIRSTRLATVLAVDSVAALLPFRSATSAVDPELTGTETRSLPFARAAGDKIIEGRVVTQDLQSKHVCNIGSVSDRQLEPVNVRGCRGLDDVKVTAYDKNRNILATALTYASDRATGPAHGYY